jgi:hypothetical protein
VFPAGRNRTLAGPMRPLRGIFGRRCCRSVPCRKNSGRRRGRSIPCHGDSGRWRHGCVCCREILDSGGAVRSPVAGILDSGGAVRSPVLGIWTLRAPMRPLPRNPGRRRGRSVPCRGDSGFWRRRSVPLAGIVDAGGTYAFCCQGILESSGAVRSPVAAIQHAVMPIQDAGETDASLTREFRDAGGGVRIQPT